MKRTFIPLVGLLLLTSCSSNDIAMNRMNHEGMHGDSTGFLPGKNVDVGSLPEAKPSEIINVTDGDTIELNPMLIRNAIGDTEFAMYGYNGQFPGPTLKVKQGSTFTVNVKNQIDLPTTVHWHGIRLQNKFDGAAGITQKAIEPGGSFQYTVTVPDDGIFWYHPHVREDIQQDMGLYGLIHVLPKDPDAYPPADREEYVILDDIQFHRNGLRPYGSDDADHALMGRFGNVLFINGNRNITPTVQKNEVVRFYFLNAANTRIFRLRLQTGDPRMLPLPMKLIGGDAGQYEKEEWVDAVTIAPSERYIVDVQFDENGLIDIVHEPSLDLQRSPRMFIGHINVVDGENASENQATELLSHDIDLPDADTLRDYSGAEPDKTLHLTVETGMGHMGHGMMMDHASEDGIEWEDTMAMMNQMSNKSNTEWKLIDEETGNENMDIHWEFKKGDVVKLRIINDSAEQGSDHAMQHPIHLHGQRFLVLSDNGAENDNLVWKDTVLIPSGHTADLLVEMSNPGDWMIHCHIAEHLANGMMGMFTVK